MKQSAVAVGARGWREAESLAGILVAAAAAAVVAAVVAAAVVVIS